MMSSGVACYSSLWTREQDKAFEIGLAIISENDDDRWRKMAEIVPGKTIEEIKYHYEILVEDINAIESDLVPLPCYVGYLKTDNLSSANDFGFEGEKIGKQQNSSSSRKKSSRSEGERRRKGIAWSEEEHRLFLEGLAKYGKGDWRSISRHFVISRTPTQVASHAQKYFIRLNSSSNEKRRPSIHDINNKGKAIESLNSSPPVKSHGSKASGRKNGPNALLYDDYDISNFVPPTIVQSLLDFMPEIVKPTDVDSLQKKSINDDDMALSPESMFADLPELTKLH